MGKTMVLMVYGDGDYGAMTFEQNFSAQKIYEEMLEEGVTEKTVVYEDSMYGDEDLHVSLHEFGEVDVDFINYMVEEFMDYDSMKAKDFYILD